MYIHGLGLSRPFKDRFVVKKELVEDALRKAIEASGNPVPQQIVLQRIPFSGQWGWASPVCFKMASDEAKSGRRINVKERAQELAEGIKRRLESQGRFHKVAAENGYLNLYFETGQVAEDLIRQVLAEKEAFGRGQAKAEKVMIEYSQPNTHKAFHVGHLRNVCLGNALTNIVDFAGFETVPANYLGDIGLHVIKCLWCYLKYHRGQEPRDPKERGRWLGEVYAEAAGKLSAGDEYRTRALALTATLLTGGISPSLRKRAISHLFQHAEAGLAEHHGDKEWRKDLLTVLELLLTDQSETFNAIAHRPIADWVWSLWLSLAGWLETARQECAADSQEAQRIDDWASRYQKIGQDSEAWGLARDLRRLFQKWESNDPEIVDLWKRTRQWSLDDFDRIYRLLRVEFDVLFYEHEVEEEGKKIVEEIIAQGLATDLRPNGPVLVEIDKHLGHENPDYRTLVILRSDGTSLYSTKDLALAKRKFQEYGVDRSIYVVDVGQALYFRQVFKVLELWGFKQAPKCFHLAYEIVRLPAGKMSSREGSVVLFDDFYEEALNRAMESVEKKRSEEQYAELPDLDQEERKEAARAVALGAVKYGMLSVDNNKPISFDFESALSLDGQTAPYIQYAHARACRILEKAGGFDDSRLHYVGTEVSLSEVNLLEQIANLQSEVERAAREYKPLYIAVYLYQLAKAFNDFYRDCPVLRAEEKMRHSRLGLVAATRQTLANGLRLLGIPAPRAM